MDFVLYRSLNSDLKIKEIFECYNGNITILFNNNNKIDILPGYIGQWLPNSMIPTLNQIPNYPSFYDKEVISINLSIIDSVLNFKMFFKDNKTLLLSFNIEEIKKFTSNFNIILSENNHKLNSLSYSLKN